MFFELSQIHAVSEAMIFLSVILMLLSKRNVSILILYIIQSSGVIILMLSQTQHEMSLLSLLAVAVVFFVKIIVAPRFLYKLIQQHYLKFAVNTYLGTTLTLIVMAVLTAFAYSSIFKPLTLLAPKNETALIQALAAIFISLFLIINRKGALSQIIGVLSLENAIISFALIAGLKQTAGLEIGIMFDIFIWIIIATVFVSKIYKQFGTLDITTMRHLKEE